jgi:hypothetical protein
MIVMTYIRSPNNDHFSEFSVISSLLYILRDFDDGKGQMTNDNGMAMTRKEKTEGGTW